LPDFTVQINAYVYGNSEILHNFVKHMYAKSISDLLIKFLNIDESMFGEDMEPLPAVNVVTPEEVVEIKGALLSKIVEKLSSNATEEDNWNAT
jgi:hypothetical protein